MKLRYNFHFHTAHSCDSACMKVTDVAREMMELGMKEFGVTNHLHTGVVMKVFANITLVAILLVCSCMTMLLAGCHGVAVVRESGTHYVADAIKPYIQSGELPGAISILYKDGVQETVCAGYANVAGKVPMSMDRMFMQCSQTKGFCGVTVAMLIEEGKIDLGDPVSKYLPEFKNLNIRAGKGNTEKLIPAKNVLTIRMVMNHTGGLPFEIPYKVKHGWSSKNLRDTAREAAANPLLFEPGTGVQYSNTGIDIGAAIVEVVTGKKWEDFLQERVFEPLDMRDASFKPTDEQLSRTISLYWLGAGKPAVYLHESSVMRRPYNGPNVYPSAGAGLWITAEDQLKFYKMLMNLGIGDNGVRILKTETVRKYLATSTRPPKLGEYSLGLRTDAKNGWFGHGGAWGTSCMVNPEKKQLDLWVVQLVKYPRPWDKARRKAADAFFAEKVDDSGIQAYTGRMK